MNGYEKRKAFVGAVDGIEPGASKGRTSWSHWGARQVFVKLTPIGTEWTYYEVGLPPRNLREISHELVALAIREANGGEPSPAPAWSDFPKSSPRPALD